MTTQSLDRKSEILVIKRESGVALLMFEAAARYNSLGSTTIKDLDKALDLVEADPSIKAVVGISGKADNFIIGADLHEIRNATSKEELLNLSQSGQALLNRIASFKRPFIMAINGACLGGGLEIALAGHLRVASNSESTIMGLPETRLGLIPGLGGTQRLPRLVGLKAALDLILSANPIKIQKAQELGIIEMVCAPDELIETAEKAALALLDSSDWQDKVRSAAEESTGVKAGKYCLKDMSEEKAEKLLSVSERAIKLRTKGNYPAQTEAIRVIGVGLKEGMKAGLEAEARAFADLAFGEVSANLISLFFSSDLAKSSTQALIKKFPDSRVKTIGIIGAGNMGSSLAQIAALNGINVILKTSEQKLSESNEKMYQLCQRAVHQKSVRGDDENSGKAEPEKIFERISVVTSFDRLKNADLIIECIIEDSQVKSETLNKLSEISTDKTIIASNTSALSIGELSTSVKKPENFLGIHFFHPIDKMPLVELVSHAKTSRAAIAMASDLVLKLDKIPLSVKDKPGFLINRLLTVYLFELARLAQEQTPLNWIEDTMLEFGMPMGPLQLMDEIGIDVAFTVARNLEIGLGTRMQSPEIFKSVCAIGMQGKRSNVGFYLWEGNEKKIKINPDMLEKTGAIVSSEKCPAEEKARIVDRMILSMLDEAARCLEEKVVAKAREVDFALILGVGFPAFRGGLLRYADQQGLPLIVQKLEKFYKESKESGSSGDRQVSPLLAKYVDEGRSFYSLQANKED